MERDNWNNRSRYDNDRNQYRGNEGRVDEDRYRGAYRLDNSSDHRNETTWDGFDRDNRSRSQGSSYNRDYNNDYNNSNNRSNQGPYESYFRDYNSSQQGRSGGILRDEDYDRDRRYQYEDRRGNTRNWDEQYQSTSGGRGTRFGGSSGGNFGGYDRQDRDNRSERGVKDVDKYGGTNFNTDYSPDNYGSRRRGENYGNMAGSLSFGYDGDRNSDPDWDRTYNPQSGERRSYHGNYESRHPERGQYRDNASRNRNDDNNDWF